MKIKNLPHSKNIETPTILKKAIKANRALTELNGTAKIIPNQKILINGLVLQEANVYHNDIPKKLINFGISKLYVDK